MTQSPDRRDQASDQPDERARDDERVDHRAELLPEERVAGSDDPHAQAEAILEESDERTEHPEEAREESTQTPDQPNPNEPS
jgi:hypothetical protein